MRVLTAALSPREGRTTPMSTNVGLEKSTAVQPYQEAVLKVWMRNDSHDVILREKKKAMETASILIQGMVRMNLEYCVSSRSQTQRLYMTPFV